VEGSGVGRCRDVFEGFIPTCACFHSENFFATCFCCFLFLRDGKEEERWNGNPEGRCMVCKVRKYRTLLFTMNK